MYVWFVHEADSRSTFELLGTRLSLQGVSPPFATAVPTISSRSLLGVRGATLCTGRQGPGGNPQEFCSMDRAHGNGKAALGLPGASP